MTTSAVDIVGVSKNFGATRVLDDINLEVREHEFVSLLGPSGCGKSTLLRIVSGFESASSGVVRINGTDVTSTPPHRRPTNIVFQRGALFPHMNVFDNIAYSLRLKRMPRARIASKVDEMLALVRMEGFASRGAAELSGGQVQRVALARALAADPGVLLLDEPLSALDLKLRQQMQLELRSIQKQLGATFIFVTHDQTEALAMSDRIAVMNGGRIVQYGTPREIYTSPTTAFASNFIGETNLIPGVVGAAVTGGVTIASGSDEVIVPAKDSLVPGTAVTMSVRPEAVRVSALGPKAKSTAGFVGELDEIIYLGSSVRIGARRADGSRLWADVRDDEAEGLARGDRVEMRWAPSALTVWEAEDA